MGNRENSMVFGAIRATALTAAVILMTLAIIDQGRVPPKTFVASPTSGDQTAPPTYADDTCPRPT
jgi:hypothetical protein